MNVWAGPPSADRRSRCGGGSFVAVDPSGSNLGETRVSKARSLEGACLRLCTRENLHSHSSLGTDAATLTLGSVEEAKTDVSACRNVVMFSALIKS